MIEFKGRLLTKCNYWKGKAVVSHQGVNLLATFQKSMIKKGLFKGMVNKLIGADQNNPDIFKKDLAGKALCLPTTIGSTTGGLVIQTICFMKINPACFLFAEHIDSLAASGIVLAEVWENSNLIVIDNLGYEFLKTVKTGDTIEVTNNGIVRIYQN